MWQKTPNRCPKSLFHALAKIGSIYQEAVWFRDEFDQLDEQALINDRKSDKSVRLAAAILFKKQWQIWFTTTHAVQVIEGNYKNAWLATVYLRGKGILFGNALEQWYWTEALPRDDCIDIVTNLTISLDL